MRLPRLLVLTDRTMCARPLVDVVSDAVGSGARMVLLREKDLPHHERAGLAAVLRPVLDVVGGLLVTAGPRGRAVHLAASDLLPFPRPAVVGRSCHDAGEVAKAAAEGCDYVTLSPVFATASKPGYGPALGPAGLAGLLTGCPPAYALGGILPEHVATCRGAGAHGVAVMGPVMRDPQIVAQYLAALTEAAR